MKEESFTTEEISQILKVSKLTVYDLIKKGELAAYKVGRQMRVDAADLEAYKNRTKKGFTKTPANISQPQAPSSYPPLKPGSIIISGQDSSLDLLAKYIEKKTRTTRPLRSYAGSIDGLFSMYKGEVQIASTHLLDGDTLQYNLSYIKKLLISHSFLVIRFISRKAGLYVAKGNPKQLSTWEDLKRPGIVLVNREKGSGARVLLDEQLRISKIPREDVNGYHHEVTSHFAVAGAIAKGEADVGVGIEKPALFAGIDFIPLINEHYDLVVLKNEQMMALIPIILDILQSDEWKKELSVLGYDVSNMGEILYEQ
ncbi:putative molybdopterin biosynthesis protein [Oikeobacillus pervagus]|uniref:Molybdopterin biosynthesis protein n=1 Tax=Oikeobacillus pervagus TaxID=1325931 RepID=A0AAJ1T0L3_9BACI|nr:helix-turn-helix transcriptional regulator [Oikeobacillus pervagus]MDQ0216059.1 putative molybdopterin biosynthesis protein [Oikeobacillus pervagus]